MSRGEWSSKLTEIWGRLKIIDGKKFIAFLLANAIAIFAGMVFSSINMTNRLNTLISVVSFLLNGFYINHINNLMKELKDKVPIPYRYLPDKYQEIKNINAWVPISILSVMVFLYLDWAISIFVIAVYWVEEWLISVHKIKIEENLSAEDNKNRLVKIYLQLQDKEKIEDLIQLLKTAHDVNGEKDYASIIDLSCEFFWCCLDDEIKATKVGKEFDLTYEQLYWTTYQCIASIYEKLGTKDVTLPDFITHMNSFLKELHYRKYLSETVLAAIIAFSCFQSEGKERANLIGKINSTLKMCDSLIRNILFLCLEFLFQYNENKRNTRLILDDNIVALYNYEFKHNIDIRLYYFLWLMWINEMEKKISDSIISFYEFIEYCKNSKRFTLIEDEHRICKTQSLYILINEVKPEREIKL